MTVRIGTLDVKYSARGNPTYTLELAHDGLKKHRLIRGDGESIVRLKAQLQVEEWEQRWAVAEERHLDRTVKAAGKRHQDQQKAEAAELTAEADGELKGLAGLLKASLQVDDQVDWASLKDTSAFAVPLPTLAPMPADPPRARPLREPQRTDTEYAPVIGLFDKLISSRRDRIEREAEARFQAGHQEWELHVQQLDSQHAVAVQALQTARTAAQRAYDGAIAAWHAAKAGFELAQSANNATVDAKRAAYEARDTGAIVEYCDGTLRVAISRLPAARVRHRVRPCLQDRCPRLSTPRPRRSATPQGSEICACAS